MKPDEQVLFPRLGCVIMASGEGRRFGGNKLMADFGGQPLICRALAAAAGCFGALVVVTRHAAVADVCREQGVRVLLHDLPLRSDTVRLGLGAMPESIDGCMFCPGDQPLLTRKTVQALCRCFAQEPQQIWRPAFAGEPGAPVLFPRWAFPELSSLPEGKGGGAVIRRYPEQVSLLTIGSALELADVDTPEALAALLAFAGEE